MKLNEQELTDCISVISAVLDPGGDEINVDSIVLASAKRKMEVQLSVNRTMNNMSERSRR